MPRLDKRVHYIYKIVCNVNQKFYIGMHSTNNLEDGYFGSGKVLRRSLNKYGKEAHTKEILEFLESREELKLREKELVNESLLIDPLCMNLKIGGEGGNSGANGIALGGDKFRKCHEYWESPINKKRKSNILKESMNRRIAKGEFKGQQRFLGKCHSDKTKKLMSEKAKDHTGNKNSQFGTIWITDGTNNKKIKNSEIIPENWNKGRTTK